MTDYSYHNSSSFMATLHNFNTISYPNSNDILNKYINKELTNIEAAKLIGVSRGTFFRLVKERKSFKR